MVLINHSTRGEGVRSQGERRRRLIGRGEQPSDDESVTDGRSSISSPSIFFLFFFCFTPVSVRPSWYHVSSSVFCFIISEPIIRKKRVPFSLLNRTESQGGASHACCLVKSCTWFFVIGRNLFFLDRSSISIRVSVLYHLDIVSLPPSARRPQLGGPRRFLFLFFPLHEHSKGTAFISNLISIYETFLWTLFNWNQSWIHLVFFSPAPIETSSSKRSMESSWSKPFSSHLSLSENGWKIPSNYPYGYPCGGNGGS